MRAQFLSLSLIGFAAQAVHAHHAFSGNYDIDLIGTVEGVVEEVAWGNPHVHYYITVANEDGSQELWDVETGNLRFMSLAGWTRNTIQIGETIKVTGPLGTSGKHRVAANSFEKEDGTVLSPSRSPDPQ
ncbi:MAG: hypothetical protein HOM55_04110 [Proteobacteria bacterium]|jgi:hypothetical protein|nr:hypothetical protein [Pseudomonadota bacterium]